jgi:hypothetical protein
MLSRGERARFLDSLGELVAGGETTFEPNVNLLLEVLVIDPYSPIYAEGGAT